ncbi:DUF6308 family protein, partial [Streptomyces sp. PH10-H1]
RSQPQGTSENPPPERSSGIPACPTTAKGTRKPRSEITRWIEAEYPITPQRGRPDSEFFALLAECIVNDLKSQTAQFKTLTAAAPDDVSLLRVFDVVAWSLRKTA